MSLAIKRVISYTVKNAGRGLALAAISNFARKEKVMKEVILVKYGEIILKGLNRSKFEDMLIRNIKKVIGKENIHKQPPIIF